MLKNFLYLNSPALDSYLSALEDGLRGPVEARKSTSGSLSGKVGLSVANAGGERGHQEEEAATRADTASARFERLQKLARQDTESSGWVDVLDAENDLKDLLTGALIEVECEVYIPEIVKALSPSGGLTQAIEQIEALAKVAPALGTRLEGMPDQGQLDALKSIGGALGAYATFVGEIVDADFHVAGRLLDEFVKGEIEGFARVVGKVSTRWGTGQWKPLLALPGATLMSREQRRELERKGPDAGQEASWLEGPALMLDVLAIYR
jgi:hypothetical protein